MLNLHVHANFEYSQLSKQSNSKVLFLKVKKYAKIRNGSTIRTQIQPSKPKREITKITNSQNTKITYGQPSEQLFPKRWPLSNPNRTKNRMNTRKVKRHRKTDTKNRQQRIITALERSVMNYWGLKLVLRAQPQPQ